MVEPARLLVSLMRCHGVPAWYYRASYVPESMRTAWALGLPHANDIPFFFRTIDATAYVAPATTADWEMARIMSGYFVNFARVDDPNGKSNKGLLPAWPLYDDKTRPVMDFTAQGARGGSDPWRERLDLVEASFDRPGAVVAPINSTPPPPPAVPLTTATVLIGDLVDDPATFAILKQHMPALVGTGQLAPLGGMTLRGLQPYMESVITPAALAAIDADLAKLLKC